MNGKQKYEEEREFISSLVHDRVNLGDHFNFS